MHRVFFLSQRLPYIMDWVMQGFFRQSRMSLRERDLKKHGGVPTRYPGITAGYLC